MKYVIKDNKSVFKGFFKVDALTLDYDCFEGGQLNNVVREVFMRGEAVGVLLVDIRRQLAGLPVGDAIETLLSNLKETKSNTELLMRGMR